MPRGDMTGPPQGGAGRGMGSGRGGGGGAGAGGGRSGGGGRGAGGGNRAGAGPGGECVCPKCGATVAHQLGTPCYNINCPKCGTRMARA